MSQGKVGFLKKVTIQKHKADASSITFDDVQNIKYSQRILNASINTGDIVTDNEMPPSMFNASLDWGEGTINDSSVFIYSGEYGVSQDLFESNLAILMMSDFIDSALASIQSVNNSSEVEDVNYTFTNNFVELNDAAILASEIIG